MGADAKFWDGLAEKYARKPVEDVAAYERKLDMTKSRLSPEDVILDIGCGTGSLALELAPLVSHVHAVDISRGMLEIARRKADERQVSNVTFHQAAVQELPHFEPASLDGVCAYNILHLVRERAALLEHVMKLLKPGAFFISSTVCLGESYVPYQPILTLMRWLGKAPSVEVLGIEELLRELRDAGFVGVSPREVGAKKTVAFIVASKPAS